jgi:hypothetical protein
MPGRRMDATDFGHSREGDLLSARVGDALTLTSLSKYRCSFVRRAVGDVLYGCSNVDSRASGAGAALLLKFVVVFRTAVWYIV